jgi:hypothetical protein
MSTPQRPVFFEGQYVAATDLDATVSHARDRAARHDRYLHEWGIAEGLALTTEDATDPTTGARFVTVTLQPGVAIDGTGREVVVPEPVPLGEDQFRETNGADPVTKLLYPVFLAGLDRDPAAVSLIGADTGLKTRADESFQIIFGRLGDERLVTERPPAEIDAGPGDGTQPWHILLGFVGWENGRFRTASPRSGTVSRRTAGVRADVVAAPGGTLTLRSQLAAGEGGAAVTLTGENGLSFGLYKADGAVEELLGVSARGDLRVRGTIAGGPAAGSVAAVSGIATDGMVLPLPAGLSTEQVESGQVSLHVSATPQLTGTPPVTPPAAGTWLPAPIECRVGPDRRLHCRVRWLRIDAPDGIAALETPGAAAFLVLAAVSSATPSTGSTENQT